MKNWKWFYFARSSFWFKNLNILLYRILSLSFSIYYNSFMSLFVCFSFAPWERKKCIQWFGSEWENIFVIVVPIVCHRSAPCLRISFNFCSTPSLSLSISLPADLRSFEHWKSTATSSSVLLLISLYINFFSVGNFLIRFGCCCRLFFCFVNSFDAVYFIGLSPGVSVGACVNTHRTSTILLCVAHCLLCRDVTMRWYCWVRALFISHRTNFNTQRGNTLIRCAYTCICRQRVLRCDGFCVTELSLNNTRYRTHMYLYIEEWNMQMGT